MIVSPFLFITKNAKRCFPYTSRGFQKCSKRNTVHQSCPISLKNVNARIVRIVSFLIAISAFMFIVTHYVIFAYLIFADFILRIGRKEKYSLFYIIAAFIVKKLSLTPQWCDESPKRFAMYLGLVFSVMIVIACTFGWCKLAAAFAAILSVCAILETLFDFCIGCKLYFAIQFLKAGITHDRNFH